MIAGLAIGAAELLAMVGLSVYAAVTLPPGARIPMHWGGSYGNFRSKRTALLLYPGIGAVIFVLLANPGNFMATHHMSADMVREIFLPLVMAVLVVTQVGAIVAARRRSGAAR